MSKGRISDATRRSVYTRFGNRCSYCLAPQHLVYASLEIEHIIPNDGTHILGRTPCGRATVLALRLNNMIAVTVRRQWTSVGWHPPSDYD
jgi:5-methylcytosine-specific restriction endonuclease McrA